MSKEDKYSLGYVICNSIQNNKDKIEKLENQLKRCRRKKEQVENKCGEYKYRIDKTIEYIKAFGVRPKEIDSFVLLEILKGDSNE